MLLYESHFKCKGTYRLKIKVQEKIYQATKNQNRVVKDFYTVKSLAFASEKSFCHKITNQG